MRLTKIASLLLATALALPLAATAAVDLKGAHFNDSFAVANQPLQLNGAGIRVKYVFDVYAAGLYVGKKDHAASAVLSQAGPKSLQIVLLRNLTGEEFADAMVAGFKKNNGDADVARFQSKLDEIKALMLTFGDVKKGTAIRIDFLPGTGMRFYVNGEQKGHDMAGDDFFAPLLKIWLGEHPVDEELKEALLGQK